MKITVTKKALTDGLALLERIIPSRSSNPLLTSVLMQAGESGLTMSGTNLEIDQRVFVPAEVEGEATLTVPAHLFSQIARNLGGELVELELNGKELVVRASGSEFKLQTGEAEAYPVLTFLDTLGERISGPLLAKALSDVNYAASTEAFQAVFRGIKLEMKPDGLRTVGSDGFRLALHDVSNLETELSGSIIIPGRSIPEILRAIGKSESVRLQMGQGVLHLDTGRVSMNVKLLDGDFPDYERVIPTDIKLKATLSSAALKEAVSRVAVLADKNSNNRVELIASDGKLHLKVEGDYGRGADSLDATLEGTESAMSLGFNAKYLLDALAPIEGDVTLSFSGPTSPALFTQYGDQSYRAVVVPLRV